MSPAVPGVATRRQPRCSHTGEVPDRHGSAQEREPPEVSGAAGQVPGRAAGIATSRATPNVRRHSCLAPPPGDPFARYSRRMSTMNSGRLTPMNDDFGDQFPGALPATTPTVRADERVVRMPSAYAQKVAPLVQAGRDAPALELPDTFVEEVAGVQPHARRDVGRRTP